MPTSPFVLVAALQVGYVTGIPLCLAMVWLHILFYFTSKHLFVFLSSIRWQISQELQLCLICLWTSTPRNIRIWLVSSIRLPNWTELSFRGKGSNPVPELPKNLYSTVCSWLKQILDSAIPLPLPAPGPYSASTIIH